MVSASERPDKWQELESWNSYVLFSTTNKSSIVDFTNIESLNAEEILGFRISTGTSANWSEIGRKFTNVVWLKVETASYDLSPAFFSAITNYPNLQYLDLDIRHALAIPRAVSLLTNAVHLSYLGMNAPSVTNIDNGIFDIATLSEVSVRIGTASIPDGIRRLPKLSRLEIIGARPNPVRSLSEDLSRSTVRRLILANVLGVEEMFPTLPPELIELQVLNCRMQAIPDAWYGLVKLEVADFNHNELTKFPARLLRIPSLRLLGLDLNNIRVIPPVQVADGRDLNISLIANPIRDFAPEDEALVRRGVIAK